MHTLIRVGSTGKRYVVCTASISIMLCLCLFGGVGGGYYCVSGSLYLSPSHNPLPTLIVVVQLEFLREMKMTWTQCSEVLMVSRTTLWRRCQALGMTAIHNAPCISDNELDAVMQMLVRRYPNCGSVMMWGHLRGYGIGVSRRRVRESLLRVSPRLVELRTSTTVVRRRYNVASSNALWHIDGLHCLIRWRIVIHGGIDGYSRRIVYLHASNNNRASTVFENFLAATKIYGWPSRVRSDYGGENFEVARAMLLCRGVGRSSHIAGSSVHNQRIERLWRDAFTCVCHTYYNLFYEMEESGLLEPLNLKHLFCLHYIYIPRINLQLRQFVEGWNSHPLRTEGGLSPVQLWTRGVCFASQSVLLQPSEYGVDAGYVSGHFDGGSVVVPDTRVELTCAQLSFIEQHHPPLAHSDYNGVDLYLSLYGTVSTMVP